MSKSTVLWHSELVKLTAEAPIPVKVKTKVMESNYKDRKPYCVLIIDGKERNYNVETETIREQLNRLEGKTAMIQAGGRDEGATLAIAIAAGMEPSPRDPELPPTTHHAPAQSAPPPGQTQNVRPSPSQVEQTAVKELEKFAARHANALWLIRLRVRKRHQDAMAANPNEGPMSEDCEQKLATTIFIAADRKGMIAAMPYKPLENYL